MGPGYPPLPRLRELSEADDSLSLVNARDEILGWAAAEFLLLLPALSGLLIFALAGSLRSLRFLSASMFLQTVMLPYSGAAVGAVLGAGVSGLLSRSPDAVFLIGIALVLQLYLGGTAAGWLGNDLRERVDQNGPGSWLRDAEHLETMYRVSREDCLLFQQRADRMAAHGKQLRAEAYASRFRAYWRSRRRIVRAAGYAWVAFGLYIAIRQAEMAHSAWYLASLVTGGSWLAAVFLVWRLERDTKNSDGAGLEEGAEEIRRLLQLLPCQPSAWQRLGIRAPCCQSHSSSVGWLGALSDS